MSNLYDDYGLEMEDEPSSELPLSIDSASKTKTKGSGHWLRTILALILGIIIGIGGVVGGGFIVLNSPARPTIELIGGFAGIDYEAKVKNQFLAETYEDKTLLEIGMQLGTVVQQQTLAGLVEIVPAVGDYVDKLVDSMKTEFGVKMNKDTIINTPFKELPNYLGETFRTTPMGDMLRATSKNDDLEPLLMELCYGQEGIHYYLDENGKPVMYEGYKEATFETLGSDSDSMVNNVSLASVIPADADDALRMYLLYGRKDVHYDENLNSLQMFIAISDDNTRVYNEYGEPIALQSNGCQLDAENKTFTDKDGTTYTYQATGPKTTLKTNDGNEEKVYYLFLDGEKAMFHKNLIGDLSGENNLINKLTDRLTITEILGEDLVANNKFLKHLKDSTVTGLPEAIEDLTIGQVFEEEIYITCTKHSGTPKESKELDESGNPIMINDGDYYYVDDNGNWHYSETETAIRGTWKYLLKTGTDADGNPVYSTDYKVAKDMNQLLSNMTENVKTATLYDMYNNDVMDFDPNMMNTQVKTTIAGHDITDELEASGIDPTTYPTLGSMPTNKILSYLSIVIEKTP